MAVLPLLSAGLGLASSIYGGIKSAQANKEFENQINQQQSQADTFFNNRVNRDFMETNAAKSVVEQLRKRYLDQAKEIDSQTAVTGGTAEANIAAKGQVNENYNDVMSNVASQATGYQENAENNYQNQISDIAQQRMMLAEKKNQNTTNLMAAGASLLGTAADLGALDGDVNATGKTASQTGITASNRASLNGIAKNAVLSNPLKTKLKQMPNTASDFYGFPFENNYRNIDSWKQGKKG